MPSSCCTSRCALRRSRADPRLGVATHALTAGAIGGMTIGMMTRTARATPRGRCAPTVSTSPAYLCVLAAALVRGACRWWRRSSPSARRWSRLAVGLRLHASTRSATRRSSSARGSTASQAGQAGCAGARGISRYPLPARPATSSRFPTYSVLLRRGRGPPVEHDIGPRTDRQATPLAALGGTSVERLNRHGLLPLKLIHQSAVTLSITGFVAVARRAGEWPGCAAARRAPLPHIVDTVLLASAITLAWMLRLNPFTTPWLGAKIVGLLAYIGPGHAGAQADAAARRAHRGPGWRRCCASRRSSRPRSPRARSGLLAFVLA